MPEITDMLAIAKALTDQREGDKEFQGLLGEISTALSEILLALEKPKAEVENKDDITKAIVDAIIEGMSKMSPPQVNVAAAEMPQPLVKLMGYKSDGWKFDFENYPNGGIKSMTAKRLYAI